MDLETRKKQLEQLAEGALPPRDLAGLSRRDVQALAHLGRVAFESQRFEQAARIFAGLEVLEPDIPEHSLRRAHAETRAGVDEEALSAINRYIDREEPRPKEDIRDALLLRATLLHERDPEAALLDVTAAKILSDSGSEMGR